MWSIELITQDSQKERAKKEIEVTNTWNYFMIYYAICYIFESEQEHSSIYAGEEHATSTVLDKMECNVMLLLNQFLTLTAGNYKKGNG